MAERGAGWCIVMVAIGSHSRGVGCIGGESTGKSAGVAASDQDTSGETSKAWTGDFGEGRDIGEVAASTFTTSGMTLVATFTGSNLGGGVGGS